MYPSLADRWFMNQPVEKKQIVQSNEDHGSKSKHPDIIYSLWEKNAKII